MRRLDSPLSYFLLIVSVSSFFVDRIPAFSQIAQHIRTKDVLLGVGPVNRKSLQFGLLQNEIPSFIEKDSEHTVLSDPLEESIDVAILSRRSQYDRLRTSKIASLTNELCFGRTRKENMKLSKSDIETAMQLFAIWRKRAKYSPRTYDGPKMMHYILRFLVDARVDLSELLYVELIEICGRSDEADRAEKVFEEMQESGKKPTISSYNALIEAWGLSSDENSSEKANAILQKLIANYSLSTSDVVLPNLETFHNVMNAFSKSWDKINGEQCGQKAEEVFNQMKDINRERPIQLKPTVLTYNILLSSWANSMHHDCVENVERIFKAMEDEAIRPDNYSFSSLLMALANVGDKDIIKKTDEIVKRMEDLDNDCSSDVKLNSIMYNTLMNVWLRSDEEGISDERARALVSKMESSPDLSPDTVTYNILMKIYSNLDTKWDKGDGKRAESVLRAMEDSEDPNMVPDIISYNTVLNAWAKGGHAEKAQALLEEMEKKIKKKGSVKPDRISYHTVIDAWASSSHANAAEQAEMLLDRMELLYRRGFKDLKPTSQSFNMVLNTLSKSNDPEAAERSLKILSYMEEAYNDKGKFDIRPDVVAYTTVMNTLAKSNLTGKAKKTKSILNKMMRLYKKGYHNVRPNILSYGTVLNACAYSKTRGDKEEAIQIALNCIDEIKEKDWLSPTHVIYATLFQTISRCMPRRDERRELELRTAFNNCCSDGQVSSLVMRNLREAAGPKLYFELIGEELASKRYLTESDLPFEWTRSLSSPRSRMSTFRRTGIRAGKKIKTKYPNRKKR